MLSVNWEKMVPYYHCMLSYPEQWLNLTIDAHDGAITEKEIKENNGVKNEQIS